MTKFILIILVLLSTAGITSNAQLFIPYTAKDTDGMKTLDKQVKSSRFPDAELFIIGTMSGEIPGYPISIEFDVNKGTSTAWVYIFKSFKNDSTISFALLKTIIGFQAIEVPASMYNGMMPFTPDSSLKSMNWMNSDKLITNLNQNQRYIQFKNDRPDMKPSICGLGMNNMPPLDLNKPYWMARFTSGGGNLTCIIQAETGDTYCDGIWGTENVNESPGEISVFPNPASDFLYINLSPEISNTGVIVNIYNELGSEVKSQALPFTDNSGIVSLSLDNLNSGIYFVHFTYSGKKIIKPIIIKN